MPQTKLQIIIDAKDRASAKMGKLNSTLGKMRGSLAKFTPALLGAGAALGGLGYAAKKAIDIFGVQERAEARLTAGLRNVKGMTDANAQSLMAYAAELQKVTTFGDEQIISSQAMLSTFQLNEQQIRKLTPRVLDMAASLEKSTGAQQDVESITIAVGKAMTLGVGSLTRYGVVISDAQKEAFRLADTEGKLNIITQALDENFKGIAGEVAKTTTGKMKQLGNVMGDLQEKIGGVIAEAIVPMVSKLTDWAQRKETEEKIKLIVSTLIEMGRTMVTIGRGVKVFSEALGSAIAWPVEQFIKLDAWLDRVGMKVSRFKGKTIGKVTGIISGITKWIPGLQEGGIVTKPTMAMIGEKGPEAVIPLKEKGPALGNTYNFDFSGAFVGDKDRFMEEIKAMIDRQSELRSLGGT